MDKTAETVPKKDYGHPPGQRKAMHLHPVVHQAIQTLAKREHRAAKDQAELMLIAALREAGAWTDEMDREYYGS